MLANKSEFALVSHDWIKLSLKTQQRFSVFGGTCFDVSNIIISHYVFIMADDDV